MPSDGPLILAFDTAQAQCTAALLAGDRLLASRDEAMARGQAERLMPMLEEILGEAEIAWGGIDAIAVGTGPGNFTGVRIAVAAARGLAMALSRPAIGVSRFEALAEGIPGDVLASVADRQDHCLLQLLRDGTPLGAPFAREAAADLPRGCDLLCLGHQAENLAAELECRAGPEDTSADPRRLARVAATRLGGATGRPAPLYLRPADADPPSEPRPMLIDVA
ncbi:MAG TPA: tRNA (adenosine(37)-N6)-threonylcarbamoyltransferase complex dimerization subunit type 1 TsaB [Amaricoccus sp.]|uniref:tRNA (adenosine(37)-N6)-threonylcarbamoyltransferase complex dimerization subunit type 1 TsaB n=1 Tax=Amaricoccus sp. TaxID=1872485 RepID=UPI001D9469BC|nr:tRNA (adenosine(37)-N6)-threonylcarbamoyltransferase complex dimerization subunit type 1 TsaB [Amaricoccus sp.]MCB1373100.1 tRNA (adenosine(37)-N6)-threonylcarbamoyltransferase complex dimerization subunit type 1 TsaB [Paracoccaceae bacterium]MCC0067032.1 tRNA (adenosine(37)-N6)-threonylcarbamoyltransferase complex dimerization subunit type 1 TsaB [Rhodovulum sp.]MCB1402745.1 tRNA (adenosine(37)-N6)-threonylcarbamoyltransferase complex dimerization subunit type 1 TsaB [Paracoccaceae bacterium